MKKFHLLASTALSLALLCGCSKEQPFDAEVTTGEGRVLFSPVVSLQVEEQTRAQVELPSSVKAPNSGRFSLVIKGVDDIQYLAEFPSLSNYPADLMTAGRYMAKVNYIPMESEGSYAYRFASDWHYFDVVARKTSQETITATLTNSLFTLIGTDEWFQKYYSEATLTIRTEQGNSFNFTQIGSEIPIFVKEGQKLYLSGTAIKRQTGTEVTFPEHEIGTTTARTWHKITVSASQAGEGSLKVIFDDTFTKLPSEEIELNPEV